MLGIWWSMTWHLPHRIVFHQLIPNIQPWFQFTCSQILLQIITKLACVSLSSLFHVHWIHIYQWFAILWSKWTHQSPYWVIDSTLKTFLFCHIVFASTSIRTIIIDGILIDVPFWMESKYLSPWVRKVYQQQLSQIKFQQRPNYYQYSVPYPYWLRRMQLADIG